MSRLWPRRTVVVAALAAGAGAAGRPGPSSAAQPTGRRASRAGLSLDRYDETAHVVAAGRFAKIYDPSIGENAPWYINDHTVIRATDGTWHLFGITHAEPANANDEINLAHATAPTLHGPWTKRPYALSVDRAYGETHLWAPPVIRAGSIYYMFYAGGGPDETATEINLATSTDLYHWTREPSGPLFRDGVEARDPMVLKVGAHWVMYYCATDDPAGGHHVVAYRTSTDLVHWSDRGIAYTSPDTGTGGGNTESPFVAHHNGAYHLFVGPCGSYSGGRNSYICTDIFTSDDPLLFTRAHHAGRIAAHAAEVVQDGDGTAPYAGIGGYGDSARAGSPGRVHVDRRTGSVTLSAIPLGREPIAVDWTLRFMAEAFDSHLRWHVNDQTSAPVFEAGWALDTALPTLGDDVLAERPVGDIFGYPKWVLATDGTVTLAAAYREGSAWQEYDHWTNPQVGVVALQSIQSGVGFTWSPGSYAGGTWRIGVSPTGNDSAFAERLYTAVNR